MKLGRMVHIDHTNKFSPVAKMNYAYVGHRSRSKQVKVEKVGQLEKYIESCRAWYQIEEQNFCNRLQHEKMEIQCQGHVETRPKVISAIFSYVIVIAIKASTNKAFGIMKQDYDCIYLLQDFQPRSQVKICLYRSRAKVKVGQE